MCVVFLCKILHFLKFWYINPFCYQTYLVLIKVSYLEVNKCTFTFLSEIRQIQYIAGALHWTSIKFRQVHWICLILLKKVNANLLI